MGLLNKKVLPEHLDTPEEWKGTDDDNRWMRWRLKIKWAFAFTAGTRISQREGLDLAMVFLPLTYFLPLAIWFTGWSWWYLFPAIVIPVPKHWRFFPVTLIGFFGPGFVRWESDTGSQDFASPSGDLVSVLFFRSARGERGTAFYVSRIQYWIRWHVALHWPLLLTWSFYWKSADVLDPSRPHEDRDGKVISGYRGFHRDGDHLYWGDGAGLGNFK